MDDVGVNYFFHNFIIGAHHSSRGCFNYIPSVYYADGHDSALTASMAAVGLVALANSRQQLELARYARTKYSEAVHKVNAALTSPAEYVKDSLLMSVISLGVFNQVSDHRSWMIHVQGAAALVVARGKDQFCNPISIRMFNQVRADLVIACIHGEKPFPEDMLVLQQEAAKHADASSPFWLMGELATRCADIFTRLRENQRTRKIPWPEFLDGATLLERDFQETLGLLVIQEPYTTIRVSVGDPNTIYNGRYDLYSDLWAIRLWNNWRILRMIVCRIQCFILNQVLAMDLAPASLEHANWRLQETVQILSKMGDDILATAPQALECLTSASESHHPPTNSSPENSVSGGYMMTWALSMVGKCPTTKTETRRWVIQRLQDIGRRTGVSIALQFMEELMKMDQLTG